MQLPKPETLYKLNIGGAVIDIILALIVWSIGLPVAFSQIFIAAGVCFLVGAVANWWIVKIQKQK